MPNAPETAWPELPTASWRDTYATLHLWTQIVGKIRLSRTPWLNHSWHVTLYVSARGLTTSPIPDGSRHFEIAFDFIDLLLHHGKPIDLAFNLTGHPRRQAATVSSNERVDGQSLVLRFHVEVANALAEQQPLKTEASDKQNSGSQRFCPFISRRKRYSDRTRQTYANTPGDEYRSPRFSTTAGPAL